MFKGTLKEEKVPLVQNIEGSPDTSFHLSRPPKQDKAQKHHPECESKEDNVLCTLFFQKRLVLVLALVTAVLVVRRRGLSAHSAVNVLDDMLYHGNPTDGGIYNLGASEYFNGQYMNEIIFAGKEKLNNADKPRFLYPEVLSTVMVREMDEQSLLTTKERVLRENLESYLTSVKLHLDNMERKERLLRNLVSEQKIAATDSKAHIDKVSQARALLIKELVKNDPDVVRSLLIPVIKELNLSKEEAKRVLME